MSFRWIVIILVVVAVIGGLAWLRYSWLPGSEKNRVSYSVGRTIGGNLRKESMDLNLIAMGFGIRDALSGEAGLLTRDEHHRIQTSLQRDMVEKAKVKAKHVGEAMKRESAVFLAENKEKEGVITLASGLQYTVIREGSGESPRMNDRVVSHYRGRLIDGTVFDESYSLDQPAIFPVNGVIAGWQEALQLMKVGALWEIFVPADMAYGESSPGPIPPNAALVFEIELLGIK